MYIIVEDIKLSKNFKLSEFVCKDGSNKVLYNPILIDKLQKLRDLIGKPIIINSAYRTPEHNTKIGGAPKSQHMLGKAADIKVKGMTPLQVSLLAEQIGFTGIGVYTHDGNLFTHCDIRDNRTYWKDAEGHDTVGVKSLKDIK